MAIARKIEHDMVNASFIRRMFEEGARLKTLHGVDAVFDYTLGNPMPAPPREVYEALRRYAGSDDPAMHRYMNNAGYPEVRASVASYLSRTLGAAFEARHVIMTVGAAGGMNVILKSILDPGDEVIIIVPYFVEYLFYIDNHGGKVVKVPAGPGFDLDVAAIAGAVTPRTKAVIICTPNNPTGVVYSDDTLEALGRALEAREREIGHAIYLVSDEPYRKILFDGQDCPSHIRHYRDAILVTSHSKDLALPGERIGYVAIHPEIEDCAKLMNAMTFANRTLGYVNAPAIWQKVAGDCQEASVDVDWYRRKRDMLYDGLTRIGYEMVKPGGAFYLFPRSPIPDDAAFVKAALDERLLLVPGAGFGSPGWFRIAYCTVGEETIERSMPVFERVFGKVRS